jgi:hypothetical protein
MIRPLTTAPGGFTHVLVAIDKFTKWIEYKPITTVSADQVVSFICDILHRFGFPNTIITFLGSNFHSHQFWNLYEHNSIEVKYVSVAHRWANGQVERTNGLILGDLKKRLYDENSKKGDKWIDEISSVICGLHTLSVFYRLPTEGYTQGGKFRLGDTEIRNSKVQGIRDLDRFGSRCA